jgi:hypothetical protein
MSSLQVLVERDAFRLGEPNQNAEFTKLYWGGQGVQWVDDLSCGSVWTANPHSRWHSDGQLVVQVRTADCGS